MCYVSICVREVYFDEVHGEHTKFRFLARSKAMELYANYHFIVLSRHHPDHASTRRVRTGAFYRSTNGLLLLKTREGEAGMMGIHSRVARRGT